jgi:hypothetical protein
VNTYLRHYVGCWKSAPDGKNFSFTDTDSPGYVYIPPRGYKRGDPLPFHAEALSLLEKALPKYPYIVLDEHHVTRTDLYHVVMAVREGRIGVVHDPTLKDNAKWRSEPNLLTMRSSALGTWSSRVTLVHEATHAINDYKKATIYGWQDEFLARIASAMWGRATDPGMADAAADARYLGPIANAAFVLSRYLHAVPGRMKRVSDLDTFLPDYRDATRLLNPVLDLRREIMHSVRYMEFGWWKRYTYDGV